MREEIQKTTTEISFSCDVCGDKGAAECRGCGKDICPTHTRRFYNDPFTDTDLGDFPLRFCEKCFEEVFKFSTPFKAIMREAEEKAQPFLDGWEEWKRNKAASLRAIREM